MSRKRKLPDYKLISDSPSSRVAEAFRVLRTNIQFASIDSPVKTIVVTSTAPTEGKSTTAANLAIAFAQTGASVLLMEADLRRPTVHKIFALSNQVGLTNLLLDKVEPTVAVRDVGYLNLRVITSGPIPPNPAEVLSSRRMRDLIAGYRREFDFVLIDTPPTLAVADSSILSSMVDGTILVVSAGEVSVDKVLKARNQLQGVKANILGVVLNGTLSQSAEDYYYYYYQGERK